MEELVCNDWNHGFCIFDHGTKHSKGVVILVKKDLPINVIDSFSKGDGRAVAFRFSHDEQVYFCINVYAPAKNVQKEPFYVSLYKWVKLHKVHGDIMIAGGDWNCVQNKKLDTSGISYAYLPKRNFIKFQKKNNLIDVWRKSFPDRRQFTWRQLSLNIYSRLDYWLVTKAHFPYIYSLDIKPVLKCDHNAVSMKLKITHKKRGNGFWKINNSLLKDDVYKENIRNIVNKVELEYSHFDKQAKWEMFKIKVKEYSIKYAKAVSRNKKIHIVNIEKEYNELCKNLDVNLCTDNIDRIKQLKKEISNWYEHQCKGAFVRSRARWLEFGEKSNKYFLQLEKTKGKKKEIDCIEINGNIIKDDDKVLTQIHDFYSKLYEKECMISSEFKDYLANLNFNVLSEDEANVCEGKLTENECWHALKSMNLNKSPGCDGLSVEFYRCFWGDIKHMVTDSLNAGFDKGELSCTQSQAIVTLLYKKGNKNHLDNWRPISLLNIDYKLVARVLTFRLKKVIHSIVSEDQFGFMKDRSAAECIRLVQDIIDYCQHTDTPGVVMSLDFKKGFDTIDHNFLFNLLQELKFKADFIRWIKTLYRNANGRIINCGWISENFSIERGVRQGCPLSALLFIIVAEILAVRIKQSPKIQGIPVPYQNRNNMELKDIRIAQFADDTMIFANSAESVTEIMKEVELFGERAGPKINWSKSNFMKFNLDIPDIGDKHFSENPIKCLGVHVGKNSCDLEALNWQGKIAKIKHTLDLWKMRNLTLYGKVVVIKHLVTSQLVYMATAVPVPFEIIKKVNQLIYAFLWNSKREKVKRTVCHNPRIEGGLGMVDLHSKCRSLRLSWFQKYLSGEQRAWKFLFKYWSEKIGGMPTCLKFNCNRKDIYSICKKKRLPDFYIDLFVSWSELRYIDTFKVNDVENEIIWYNSNIKYGGEMLYFSSWVKHGVFKVQQVLTEGKWKEAISICEAFKDTELLASFKLCKLKKAFPIFWLERLRNKTQTVNRLREEESNLIELVTGDSINVENTRARHYYKLFLEKKQTRAFFYLHLAGLFKLTLQL